MSLTTFKKGDKVSFTNNFGKFIGKVKMISPNPNGEIQVLVKYSDNNQSWYDTSSLEAVQN